MQAKGPVEADCHDAALYSVNDRISLAKLRPQIFGTVLFWQNNAGFSQKTQSRQEPALWKG